MKERVLRFGQWLTQRPNWLATLVFAASLTVYALTLAPGLLWGDDAELQRLAYIRETISGGRGHLLWVKTAWLFVRAIPIGEVAWRTNLFTALWAAITVSLLCRMAWHFTRSTLASGLAAMTLAVSHTFWLHAVRTEIYSLYLALLAASLASLAVWRKRQAYRWLLAAGFLAGVALWSHLLILTAVPGLLALVALSASRRLPALSLFGLSFASATAFYFITQSGEVSHVDVLAVAKGLLTLKVHDFALWAVFLGYQFVLSLPIGGLGLIAQWRADRHLAFSLALIYLGNVVWTLSFHVPDQYVFYLPSYLIFALWIAYGLSDLESRQWVGLRPLAPTGLAGLMIAVPIGLYCVAPVLLNHLKINPLNARTLPYRDNNTFFLWPPKNGYVGARQFVTETLSRLPPNAAMLADWLPLESIHYVQVIEGARPDVEVVGLDREQQIPWLLAQSARRPVFLADNEERYYDMDSIRRYFAIRPVGSVYQLIPKP